MPQDGFPPDGSLSRCPYSHYTLESNPLASSYTGATASDAFYGMVILNLWQSVLMKLCYYYTGPTPFII